MEELKTKLLIKSLIGALIGVTICIVLYAFGAYDAIIMNKPAVIAQFAGSTILGTVSMGSSVVYEIDSWGITKCTAIHYLLTLGAMLLASHLLDWFDESILFIVILIFSVAYVIIWLINYIIGKRAVNRMNEDLGNLVREDTSL